MGTNNQYEVEFTDECKKEIRKIYDYIKDNLYAENAAHTIMKKIENVIKNLKYAPKMYSVIDKYTKVKRIYRKIVIDNYVLLYAIDEANRKVYIAHMYYSGSDYINNV